MPCYSTITTRLHDINKVTKAVEALGGTITKLSDGSYLVKLPSGELILSRSYFNSNFQCARGSSGTTLGELTRQYAVEGLREVAEQNDMMLEVGETEGEIHLVQYT